ncbi:MAG TPA: YdeI/OmpD-associated family protein [Gemmatimonadaceae bacterium]
MGKRDPRVDAYIAKSADFAQPILNHIRTLVHEACPQVEESIKWGTPHFEYEGVLCGLAAFKQHCNLILWKGDLIIGQGVNEAGGPLRNITKLSDLPSSKTLTGYMKQAAKLNEQGIKTTRRSKPKKELVVPPELTEALKKNKKAAAAFEKFPPSHKREYADWISEAKGEDTRQRRVDSAIEWMAEGKSRNWKYERR